MKVLSYGEILWDIINGVGHLGGAPFNFAAHFAQYGAHASIISAVGKDKYGDEAIRIARDYGVDISLIQTTAGHPTGTVDVRLTNGVPDYTIREDVAYDYINYRKFEAVVQPQGYDIFYFGSLIQRGATSSATLRMILQNYRFPYVFYDVNLRKNCYSRDIVVESFKYCNVLKLNIEEVGVLAELLFDESFFTVKDFCDQAVATYSIKIIIVTAAENGCFIYRDGVMIHVPGKKVVLSDAVGAGDAFSASFMFEFLKHGDIFTAATKANAVGAFVASQQGAIPRYPSEMLALLEAK
jgi:fructokinase